VRNGTRQASSHVSRHRQRQHGVNKRFGVRRIMSASHRAHATLSWVTLSRHRAARTHTLRASHRASHAHAAHSFPPLLDQHCWRCLPAPAHSRTDLHTSHSRTSSCRCTSSPHLPGGVAPPHLTLAPLPAHLTAHRLTAAHTASASRAHTAHTRLCTLFTRPALPALTALHACQHHSRTHLPCNIPCMLPRCHAGCLPLPHTFRILP